MALLAAASLGLGFPSRAAPTPAWLDAIMDLKTRLEALLPTLTTILGSAGDVGGPSQYIGTGHVSCETTHLVV